MTTEIWTVIGVALTSGLAYLGVRTTSRSSRSAAKETNRIEENVTVVQGYQSLIEEYRTGRKEDKERMDDQDKRIQKQDEKIELQKTQLEEMSRRLDTYLRKYRSAIRYIIALRSHFADNPDSVIPGPPEDLLLDLDFDLKD